MKKLCPHCRQHKDFLTYLRHGVICNYCGYIEDEYPQWMIMKGVRRLFNDL